MPAVPRGSSGEPGATGGGGLDLERLGIPEPVLETYYLAYAGDDDQLRAEWPKFLKYWKGYRRIRETRNPLARGLLKGFTYWPRTG